MHKIQTIALALVLCAMMCLSAQGQAWALDDVCTVNTEKLINNSKAALAGERHLDAAQKTLQRGLDKLKAMLVEKEKKAAKADKEKVQKENALILQNGFNRLQQNFAAQRQAVLAEINRLVVETANEWIKDNSGCHILIAEQQALAINAKKTDVTEDVRELFNKKTPNFPPMPKVEFK